MSRPARSHEMGYLNYLFPTKRRLLFCETTEKNKRKIADCNRCRFPERFFEYLNFSVQDLIVVRSRVRLFEWRVFIALLKKHSQFIHGMESYVLSQLT